MAQIKEFNKNFNQACEDCIFKFRCPYQDHDSCMDYRSSMSNIKEDDYDTNDNSKPLQETSNQDI